VGCSRVLGSLHEWGRVPGDLGVNLGVGVGCSRVLGSLHEWGRVPGDLGNRLGVGMGCGRVLGLLHTQLIGRAIKQLLLGVSPIRHLGPTLVARIYVHQVRELRRWPWALKYLPWGLTQSGRWGLLLQGDQG